MISIWEINSMSCLKYDDFYIKRHFSRQKRMNIADRILYATSPKPTRKPHPTDNLMTGFIAGILSRTLIAPLDVVKMLLQTNSNETSWRDAVSHIWKKDGIKGFWRGNLVACACNGPLTAVKYFVIDDLAEIIGKNKPMSSETRYFIGAVAGILSQSICYPLDLILTRLTVHPDMYHNFFQATGRIIKEDGIFGLWHGLMPTVTGAIVYEGSQYVVSGGFKQFYTQKEGRVAAWRNLLIGACAGAVSQTIAFPFDVMRRRMMLLNDQGNKLHQSYYSCFKSILNKEGIRGFYKGLQINLIKVIPCAALQYTINEELKELVDNFRVAHRQEALRKQQIAQKRK